jgi:hypothetical protein
MFLRRRAVEASLARKPRDDAPAYAPRGAEMQYEKFMKLAGPYWMSCVTKNDATPILAPDHCLTYLRPRG